MKTINITIGLPGSGKTTFCKNAANNAAHIIETDKYIKKDFAEKLKYNLNNKIDSLYFNDIYVDGLFAETDDIIKILNSIDSKKDFSVVIHYFIPNIEACLWNDKYRRNVSSKITIENMIISKPNLEILEKKFTNIKFSIREHITMKTELWKKFAEKNNVYLSGKYLESQTWCMGGTYGNCWGDQKYSVSSDEPNEFTELDLLLEKTAPNLKFLKKLNVNVLILIAITNLIIMVVVLNMAIGNVILKNYFQY